MKKFSIRQISLIGIMAALVFVSSMFSFPVMLPIGETRIHFGNAFCLLSGFVLGGTIGGLAAGVGSMLFDLINPVYITTAPFTLVFKFLLAFVCGKIAYAGGKNAKSASFNLIAALAGSLTYIILYLSKGFIENLLLGVEANAAGIIMLTKLGASSINAGIAVVVSVPFGIAVNSILRRSGFHVSEPAAKA